MEVICPLANGNGVAYFLAGKFEIRTPMQLKVHASGSCLMVFYQVLIEHLHISFWNSKFYLSNMSKRNQTPKNTFCFAVSKYYLQSNKAVLQ